MAVSYNTTSNTSSAYDFSAYETKPSKTAEQERKLSVVKTPKQFLTSFITPKTIAFFAMTVTVVCLMVHNNVQLNEITKEMNTLTASLEEMKNEYVRMHSEKESQISPRAVAEAAEYELGLKRLDKYQTEYIYLNNEDKIELAEEAAGKNIFDKIKSAFFSAVGAVQEYIAE